MSPKAILTVVAIAVCAACITTIAHEALGHGGACLALGGHITRLTSVFFDCDDGTGWVAIGGPAGNLLTATLTWYAQKRLPPALPRLRLLAALVMLFSLFWEAGYLIYAMALDVGDWAIAARAAFGAPGWWWRLSGALLGLALYRIGVQLIANSRPLAASPAPQDMLRIAWASASLAACLAALFYMPAPWAALRSGALEIGVASFPLLIVSPRSEVSAPMVRGHWGWVAFAAALYVAFVLTLGRGLM